MVDLLFGNAVALKPARSDWRPRERHYFLMHLYLRDANDYDVSQDCLPLVWNRGSTNLRLSMQTRRKNKERIKTKCASFCVELRNRSRNAVTIDAAALELCHQLISIKFTEYENVMINKKKVYNLISNIIQVSFLL